MSVSLVVQAWICIVHTDNVERAPHGVVERRGLFETVGAERNVRQSRERCGHGELLVGGASSWHASMTVSVSSTLGRDSAKRQRTVPYQRRKMS